MIRFVLKRKRKLASGAEIERIYHIDNSVPDLENDLKSGGFGEDQYDFTELIGVEIIGEDTQTQGGTNGKSS